MVPWSSWWCTAHCRCYIDDHWWGTLLRTKLVIKKRKPACPTFLKVSRSSCWEGVVIWPLKEFLSRPYMWCAEEEVCCIIALLIARVCLLLEKRMSLEWSLVLLGKSVFWCYVAPITEGNELLVEVNHCQFAVPINESFTGLMNAHRMPWSSC